MQKMDSKISNCNSYHGCGVVSTVYFHVDAKGVALLDSVGTGLPPFFIPDFSQVDLTQAVGRADDFTGRNG